jgi:hypothetical protein
MLKWLKKGGPVLKTFQLSPSVFDTSYCSTGEALYVWMRSSRMWMRSSRLWMRSTFDVYEI